MISSRTTSTRLGYRHGGMPSPETTWNSVYRESQRQLAQARWQSPKPTQEAMDL